MLFRRLLAPAIVLTIILTTGCSQLITAYLVSQLLDDSAPKRTWSGVVRDTSNKPVEGVEVQVRGEVEGDTNIMKFTDTTDAEGKYQIKFRWNKQVQYTVQIVHEGVVMANEEFGTIQLGDRSNDFVIQGAVKVQLSGVVRGPNGQPLNGVLLIGASATALNATPVVLLNTTGKTQYQVTSDSGVYTLEGTIGRYGIVCAYHPDYGFAYVYGEDTDHNGSIALNLDMGASGNFNVKIQVVDGTLQPIASQILPAARQFRCRLGVPFNLGSAVDAAVSENSLFQGLVGKPSDKHPNAVTFTVQATGANGIAEDQRVVAGGSYQLTLLNVLNDEQATALVRSENPLVLHEDSTVAVQVN
jgi:hypothetical protein